MNNKKTFTLFFFFFQTMSITQIFSQKDIKLHKMCLTHFYGLIFIPTVCLKHSFSSSLTCTIHAALEVCVTGE